MEDMDAFERQLASVMQQGGRASRPVDATAIVHSATTISPSGRWTVITRRLRGDTTSASTEWGFSMFSALKFVAAAAIVALLGGFLLAGVLTTRQDDEMAPAAETESPSPMTTEQLLSGMVTEEVEPGVYKVVNDGVRDLAYAGDPDDEDWEPGIDPIRVDVTPDGSVWLSGIGDGRGLFHLGEERVFEGRMGYFTQVAPDGSLWSIGKVAPDGSRWSFDGPMGMVSIESPMGIFSFDGEGWTVRATTTDFLYALDVGPDGTVWVAARSAGATTLLRLEDDGSLTTIEDWADVHDGDVSLPGHALSTDGDVWLEAEGGFVRFDGEGWEAIPGPEGWAGGAWDWLASGPDGTLWVDASGGVGDANRGELARYDDAGWTTFTDADGVEPWHDRTGYWGYMVPPTVAADGSLWLGAFDDDGCDGAAHYDGTTWISYLEEYCISDLDIAPDGSVWLGAHDGDTDAEGTDGPSGLYVITPEAVAAKEQ